MTTPPAPIEQQTDVLIVGGGTAGHVAAIQAARAGATTTLVEMTGQLGGTMTTGGVAAPAYFFSQHRQVVGGIGWELVVKSVELDGGALPDFRNPPAHRPSYHAPINPYLYPAVAEEACLKAGVTLHYHELPLSARWDDSRHRWAIEFAGKNQIRLVYARELIDCTGGADLVGMLGFPRVRGEPGPSDRADGRDIRQPGTLLFRIGGYDSSTLDEHLIQQRYQQAMADGSLRPGDWNHADRPFLGFLKAGGRNVQHIFGADDSTSDAITDANVRGRAAILRLLRFIKTLPGCEKVTLLWARPDAAIRETYRIVGETTITHQDYLTARIFPDAVGHSFYFIDVHTERGTEHEFVPPGLIPTLPLSAMIPKGSRNLLAAGRCISSDRLANSALRVQASCMAMGQGAGAAAALAVQRGVASRDVPIPDLRALLLAHGAILPETHVGPVSVVRL